MKIRFFGLLAGLSTSLLLVACGPKYPNCDSNEHCKDHNQFCVDKICRDCATSENCAARGPCAFCGLNYTCEKPVGAPSDCCASDLDCQQGKCWKMLGSDKGTCAQCAGDGDCGSTMKCVQGTCVPAAECTGDADCGTGRHCDNGTCVVAQCSLEPVYFDFDESAIRADSRDTLNRNYECLKMRGQTATVEGNCDERGSDEYNLALGTRRAEATRKFLQNLGVDPSMLVVTSFGEEKPVCNERNEDCWMKCRRTDLKFR